MVRPHDSGTVLAHRFSQAGPLRVLRWPALEATGVVDALVTTRDSGVSTGPYARLNVGLHVGDDPQFVSTNRARLAAAMGASPADFVFCRQAHGPNVAVVDDEQRGRGAFSEHDALADTDALVTTTPGLVLVVMVADCVPLVMVDPVRRVLACVHAGWRGTTEGVTPAAVDAMVQLGSTPSDLLVGVGPAIPADSYQVGDDVAAAARSAFDDTSDVLRPDGQGRWLFDLWAANERQLIDEGVARANIHTARLPTGGEDFFSDRAVRPCGRFAAVAQLLS